MLMSRLMTEHNARIVCADLSIADHGVLCGWVTLEWAGAGQGFGGHVLGWPGRPPEGQPPHAAVWVLGVLRAAGVKRWSDLPGRIIRVRSDGLIRAIGHAIEDQWFDTEADFARLETANGVGFVCRCKP